MISPLPLASAMVLSMAVLAPALANDPPAVPANVAAAARPHHVYLIGTLLVSQPWIDVSGGPSGDAAGYLVVSNRGGTADRLTGATVDGASSVTVVDPADATSAKGGVVIPPNSTVEFKPGQAHLDLQGLHGVADGGAPIAATLQFERSGALHLSFPPGRTEADQDDQTDPNSADNPVKLSQ